MEKLIEIVLGSSGKITSILGYLIGALALIQPIVSKGDFDIKRDWLNIVFALLTAWQGRKTKAVDGVKPEEGFAIRQALIQPPAKEEPIEEPVIEEPKVKLNPAVASVLQVQTPTSQKKSKRVTKTPPPHQE